MLSNIWRNTRQNTSQEDLDSDFMQAKKYMTEMINPNDIADGPPSQGVVRLKCKQQPIKDHPRSSQ